MNETNYDTTTKFTCVNCNTVFSLSESAVKYYKRKEKTLDNLKATPCPECQEARKNRRRRY